MYPWQTQAQLDDAMEMYSQTKCTMWLTVQWNGERQVTYNIRELVCCSKAFLHEDNTRTLNVCYRRRVFCPLKSFHRFPLSIFLFRLCFIHQMKHEQVHHKIITYIISWHTFNAISDQISFPFCLLLSVTFYALLLLLLLTWIFVIRYRARVWSLRSMIS